MSVMGGNQTPLGEGFLPIVQELGMPKSIGRFLVGIRGDGWAQLGEWQPVRTAELERSAFVHQLPLPFHVSQ